MQKHAPTLLVLKQKHAREWDDQMPLSCIQTKKKNMAHAYLNDNQLRTNFICKELKIIQIGDVHTKDPTTLFTY